MNKSDLVSEISSKSGIKKKDVERVLSSLKEVIFETVKSGQKFQIIGFGTFELRSRSERAGIDPRTKEKIIIPASKAPAFKPGKVFKDAVSGK